MLLSELIKNLQKIEKNFGDKEIYIQDKVIDQDNFIRTPFISDEFLIIKDPKETLHMDGDTSEVTAEEIYLFFTKLKYGDFLDKSPTIDNIFNHDNFNENDLEEHLKEYGFDSSLKNIRYINLKEEKY